LEYQLILSARRKTIALQVSNAKVIVRAPASIKTAYVDKLIQSKLQWLKQKIAEQKQNTSLSPHFSLQFAGETLVNKPIILIDGLPHQVIVDFGQKNILQNVPERSLTVVLSSRYKSHDLNSSAMLTKVKAQIECWFKERIEEYVRQRLSVFSPRMSLYSSSFKVRKYKARWGSCNSQGALSFNYLLKMLPSWVVDYVIIHELCHLQHMNHSTRFWQLVALYCPDFNLAKNWLKTNQTSLNWR
jgi:predicted metal-dependent hydrolase